MHSKGWKRTHRQGDRRRRGEKALKREGRNQGRQHQAKRRCTKDKAGSSGRVTVVGSGLLFRRRPLLESSLLASLLIFHWLLQVGRVRVSVRICSLSISGLGLMRSILLLRLGETHSEAMAEQSRAAAAGRTSRHRASEWRGDWRDAATTSSDFELVQQFTRQFMRHLLSLPLQFQRRPQLLSLPSPQFMRRHPDPRLVSSSRQTDPDDAADERPTIHQASDAGDGDPDASTSLLSPSAPAAASSIHTRPRPHPFRSPLTRLDRRASL